MTREKFRFAGQTVKVRNEDPKFGGADFTNRRLLAECDRRPFLDG